MEYLHLRIVRSCFWKEVPYLYKYSAFSVLSILTILFNKCQTKSFERNEHSTQRMSLLPMLLVLENNKNLVKHFYEYLHVFTKRAVLKCNLFFKFIQLFA